MSTVNAYQRERLVDALTEELGDRDTAERLTDRLMAERDMAVYVLGGIDRELAKEYWSERDDWANEARAERDEALAALRPFAEAADILLESRRNNDDWSLWTATYPGGSTSITAAHIREARNVVDHYGGR